MGWGNLDNEIPTAEPSLSLSAGTGLPQVPAHASARFQLPLAAGTQLYKTCPALHMAAAQAQTLLFVCRSFHAEKTEAPLAHTQIQFTFPSSLQSQAQVRAHPQPGPHPSPPSPANMDQPLSPGRSHQGTPRGRFEASCPQNGGTKGSGGLMGLILTLWGWRYPPGTCCGVPHQHHGQDGGTRSPGQAEQCLAAPRSRFLPLPPPSDPGLHRASPCSQLICTPRCNYLPYVLYLCSKNHIIF